MRAVNATRMTVLMERGRHARSLWTRGMGLIGRAALAPGEGLILDPANSIHMFFMRFPLDALFLDRQGRVLRAIERLRPWRISPIVRHAHYVVELPAGTIEATQTQVGDRVELQP